VVEASPTGLEDQKAAGAVMLGVFIRVGALRKRGLIAETRENVFLHHLPVYKFNPKHVHEWPDLNVSSVPRVPSACVCCPIRHARRLY
jgi:hypothetical protein